MKKRSFAFITIISLVISLLPLSVFATNAEPNSVTVIVGETTTVNVTFNTHYTPSEGLSATCSENSFVNCTAEMKTNTNGMVIGAEVTVEGVQASSTKQTITVELKDLGAQCESTTFDVKVNAAITSASATGMTMPKSFTLDKEFDYNEICNELTKGSANPTDSINVVFQYLYVALSDKEVASLTDYSENIVEWNGSKWIQVGLVEYEIEKYKKPVVGARYAEMAEFDAFDNPVVTSYCFTDTTTINIDGVDCPSNKICMYKASGSGYDRLLACYELGYLQSDGTFAEKKETTTTTTTTTTKTKSTKSSKSTGVETGDKNNVALYSIMGILALCGAGVVLYKRKEN